MPESAVSNAQLSPTERSLIAEFLTLAADEFSDHSCNDFLVPATDANKAFMSAVVRHIAAQEEWAQEDSPEQFLANIQAADDEVFCYDDWVARYCAEQVAASIAGSRPARLSATELEIMGTVLEWSAGEHAGWVEAGAGVGDFTLAANDAHRALMAAILAQRAEAGWQAKLAMLDAEKLEFTVPDFWIMAYLAARCKARAAAPIDDEAAAANATAADAAVPEIARPGVAPRFPRAKAFAKAYTIAWTNWRDEQMALLRQYGAKGIGFPYDHFDGDTYTYDLSEASEHLHKCAVGMRWHAIRTALGADPAKDKKAIFTPAAAIKEYDKLTRAPHVAKYMQINAAPFADFGTSDFDTDMHESVDEEVSADDLRIVQHMILEGYAAADIEQAMIAGSPYLSARKGDRVQAYAADTVRDAFADLDTQTWMRQRALAAQGVAEFSAEIGGDWREAWRRSIAFEHLSQLIDRQDRANAAAARAAKNPGASKVFPSQNNDDVIACAANCIALGWLEPGIDLARYVLVELDQGAKFGDASYQSFRIHYFVLRLIADWQAWPARTWPTWAQDEPIYNALLAHWRTPDAANLAPLLLAACDRHTHEARWGSSSKRTDIPYDNTWYDPFEIVLVLKLRALLGLENPVLDHPLTDTPLGKLHSPAEPYSDAVLESVIARTRLLYPGF